MSTLKADKLPNRRRLLELVLTAVVIVAAICLAARYSLRYPQSQYARTLEDLRIIDAAADQYSLENSRTAPTPVPVTGPLKSREKMGRPVPELKDL